LFSRQAEAKNAIFENRNASVLKGTCVAEAQESAFCSPASREKLSLTRFIAGIGLVDHIDAALAAHDLAIGVALLERLERVGDFHNNIP
jgi:hypothetical protein